MDQVVHTHAHVYIFIIPHLNGRMHFGIDDRACEMRCNIESWGAAAEFERHKEKNTLAHSQTHIHAHSLE